MITLVILEASTQSIYELPDTSPEFGDTWAKIFPNDLVMLVTKVCRFCGLSIIPAPKTMDADWTHENEWYACDMAKQFAGVKITHLLGDKVLATPKED